MRNADRGNAEKRPATLGKFNWKPIRASTAAACSSTNCSQLGRAPSEPGGTRWRTGGEVKGKLANGVGSSQYSHATSERGISSITKADAHTSAASSRLNWRPPIDLNGVVRFGERRNLVSARVPSRSARAIQTALRPSYWVPLFHLCLLYKTWTRMKIRESWQAVDVFFFKLLNGIPLNLVLEALYETLLANLHSVRRGSTQPAPYNTRYNFWNYLGKKYTIKMLYIIRRPILRFRTRR